MSDVCNYWDSHTLGLQYAFDESLVVGSPEFFEHIQFWMNPFKYPWIMDHIEHKAARLKGKHLLELLISIAKRFTSKYSVIAIKN